MAIVDLKPKQGDVDLVVEVVEKGDVREFQKFGKSGRVCNAKVKDDSGEISLTLWNDDIEKVNAGDKIHIKNGYVNEWQGEIQLTTGKFGSIEILEKGSSKPSKEKKGKPKSEETEESDGDSDEDSDSVDDDSDDDLDEDTEEEVIE